MCGRCAPLMPDRARALIHLPAKTPVSPQHCLVMGITDMLLVVVLGCSVAAAATTESPLCAPYDCGPAVTIRYPFWVHSGNDEAFCGYPGLRLECRGGGTAILKLPSGNYGVSAIDYISKSLIIHDLAVFSRSGTCPDLGGRNITLPPGVRSPPPLVVSSRDVKWTFLLDCSFVGVSPRYRIPCTETSYMYRNGDGDELGDLQGLCHEVVQLPLLSTDGDLVKALHTGLELNWASAGAGDGCSRCERAGGFCGGHSVQGTGTTAIDCIRDGTAPAPAPAPAPRSPLSSSEGTRR